MGTAPNLWTKPTPPRIAFTTPSNYAHRLSLILHNRFNPPLPPTLLWCPTVIVESTSRTKESIKPYLTPTTLQSFYSIAFTSRTGISSFSDALLCLDSPPLPQTGETFTLAALGKDAELLNPDFISSLCPNPDRVRVLVPPVATPTALVESLGYGVGQRRRVLCPVPDVIGLNEPPVIPDFLRALSSKGWVPVKVCAYETRWGGPNCAASLLEEEEGVGGHVDAIVFTSTAEVEGLLKSLRELGVEWEIVKKRWPGLVVAAHGPVTAAGANRLGVSVDVVGSSFGSFDGVVDALYLKLASQH